MLVLTYRCVVRSGVGEFWSHLSGWFSGGWFLRSGGSTDQLIVHCGFLSLNGDSVRAIGNRSAARGR